MENFKIKVDFYLAPNGNPKQFWFPMTSADNSMTVRDFKSRVSDTFGANIALNEMQVFVDDYQLLDSTKLSFIKENEIIVVKRRLILPEDNGFVLKCCLNSL